MCLFWFLAFLDIAGDEVRKENSFGLELRILSVEAKHLQLLLRQ